MWTSLSKEGKADSKDIVVVRVKDVHISKDVQASKLVSALVGVQAFLAIIEC